MIFGAPETALFLAALRRLRRARRERVRLTLLAKRRLRGLLRQLRSR